MHFQLKQCAKCLKNCGKNKEPDSFQRPGCQSWVVSCCPQLKLASVSVVAYFTFTQLNNFFILFGLVNNDPIVYSLTFLCQSFILIPMDHSAQKQYFEIAYRTGSDVWTHIPYHMIAMRMLPSLAQDAFVLDIGAGRGLWMGKLIAAGYHVIGVDYISDVVRHGNEDLKLNGFLDRARFVHGDVLDLPLADRSFDAVTDVGTLQHLPSADWDRYASEIARVIKPGGYFLNISLSKDTPRFLGFRPKSSPQSDFEKFGVSYHFFTDQEVASLAAAHGFTVVEQKIEYFDAKTDPGDSVAMVFSLFKKSGA